jgi:surface antigen
MWHRRPTSKVAAILAFLALAVFAAPALADMQCTVWAHIKRPDLPSTELGDAKDWDTRAAELGFSVDRIPARGDVAVWQAGQCTRDNHGCAGRYGHVAYVVGVRSISKIRISEANWPTGSGPRLTSVNGRGLTFIHGG